MAYTGVYERTIFYNPVNKYSVISVKTSDRSIPEKARSAYRHRDNMIHFAAVGHELPRTDQVSMILEGEWKEGKNGVQLHVTQCEEVVPQTREGIKGYLSSRLIKGIGGKTAELIVDRFGADTLNVLENEPERLLEIRGVSKAKLEEIIASYNESRALRDLMLLLAPFQITPTTATKIYDHFGARSVDILRDNPFELCQVSGFGFKRVDAIMRKNNWPLNSPMRIRGAVFAALEGAKGDGGHLYLEAEQLHKEAMSLLNSMIPVPQMRVKSDDLDAVIDDIAIVVCQTQLRGFKRGLLQLVENKQQDRLAVLAAVKLLDGLVVALRLTPPDAVHHHGGIGITGHHAEQASAVAHHPLLRDIPDERILGAQHRRLIIHPIPQRNRQITQLAVDIADVGHREALVLLTLIQPLPQ